MKLNAMEWNINMSFNTTELIPDLIMEQIKEKKPDIGILTEYYSQNENSLSIENQLKELNYNVYKTMTDKSQKDVLMFILNKYPSKEKVYAEVSKRDNFIPNYLEIEMKVGDELLTVVGCRIRVQDKSNISYTQTFDKAFRISQMHELNKRLDTILGSCFIAGDFNGKENWLLQNLSDKFKLISPKECTFIFNNAYSTVLDHTFGKGIEIKTLSSFDFTYSVPEIYINGPFTIASNNSKSYPDHAQIISQINLI